jgi:hypothetical protein
MALITGIELGITIALPSPPRAALCCVLVLLLVAWGRGARGACADAPHARRAQEIDQIKRIFCLSKDCGPLLPPRDNMDINSQ